MTPACSRRTASGLSADPPICQIPVRPATARLRAVLIAGLGACATAALSAAPLLSPIDKIFAFDLDTTAVNPGYVNYPAVGPYSAAQTSAKAIDGLATTKYLNNSKYNAGVIVTPFSTVAAQSFVLTSAEDAIQRDPSSYILFGSNESIKSSESSNGFTDHWTLISMGSLSLQNMPDARGTVGTPVNFANSTPYSSYWLVFPSTKDTITNNFMQIAEIQLYTGANGTGSAIFAPGNAALCTGWNGSTPAAQPARMVIDRDINSKYLNFGENNSGFVVVPTAGGTIINSFILTTAGDEPNRDPASWTLHGQAANGKWVQIGDGTLSLPAARGVAGPSVPVANSTPYFAYRMTFPTVRNSGAANSMQVAEAQFYGTIIPAKDTDNDFMDDDWETLHGLIIGVNDGAGDLDNDGLTNLQEYQRSTLPNNPDTDDDGLKDGVETGTGVWVSLSDTGTDPLKADSDGDGYGDNYEAVRGSNPNIAASIPVITWDITPGTVGAGDSAITGGSGTWDQTTTGNWTLDGGANNVAWNNGGLRTVAVFGGTAGAVTLASPISADGIIVNTSGYTFSANTLTLSGPAPRITVASGTSEISSVIAGTAGLTTLGTGVLTLKGTSNTFTGTTTVTGTGKLVLAKDAGNIAINGDVNIFSTAFTPNNSGLVLAGDEQIADTAIVRWASVGQSNSYFRLNGHTETIGGLVSTGAGIFVAIENRGNLDTLDYPTGTLIINTSGSNAYSYNGYIRNVDGGLLGGLIAVTKTGTGTQTLAGGMSYTGPTIVNGGLLEVNGTLNGSLVTVTDTGTLAGTGSLGQRVTVQAGGTLSPGIGGVGTLAAVNGVTLGAGGTLAGNGTLNGPITVASGGILAGAATVIGAVTVQSGGTLGGTLSLNSAVTVQTGATLAPGASGAGTLTATGIVTIAGEATFKIAKSGASLTGSQLAGFSAINFGGHLTVTASGDALAVGDSFQLFAPAPAGTIGGSFASVTLPTLPSGLSWNSSELLNTGAITVVDYPSTPRITPPGGGYAGAVAVTITSDSGATIYYTTDGTEPTTGSTSGASPLTGITIPVDSIMTVRAIAGGPGWVSTSPVATAAYQTSSRLAWNVNDNGLWSDADNWLNRVVPNSGGGQVEFTFAQTANTTVTLDGNYTAGSLMFGDLSVFNWTIAPANGGVLTLAGPVMPSVSVLETTTISAGIAGTQGLAKTGSGTLVLSGANTYGGTTAINAGALSVSSLAPNGSISGLGTGNAITFNGGTLRYTGGSASFGRTVALDGVGGTLDASMGGYWFTTGVFSGSGSLTKTGIGQLIVQANNTYDGITYLNQAELQIRDVNALGSTVGRTIVADGARLCAGGGLTGTIFEELELNGNGGNGAGALQANDGGTTVTYAGGITLAADGGLGSLTGIAFAITAPITGPGGLIKLTNNAVTLAGATSNSYAGPTTLAGTGKLVLAKTAGSIAIPGDINLSSTAWNGNNSGIVLAGDEQIADSAILTWTTTSYGGGLQLAAFLRLNGHTETVGGLVDLGSSDATIENRGYLDTAPYGNATLIINTVGASTYTFRGGIRDVDGGTGGGIIALIKTGAGTQVFNGGLACSGPITVNGGTLEIDCVSSSTATTVASGATLQGNGAVNGTLTINTGGTLAPGIGVGTFTSGNAFLAGTYVCEIGGAAADRMTVNGSIDLTGGTVAFATLAAPTAGSYIIASYTTTINGDLSDMQGLPAGYVLFHDATAKQIKLLKIGYESWAGEHGLSVGINAGMTQDPDADGVSNLMEYALGGNPLSATDAGVSSAGLHQVGGSPALSLTVAVRAGATFATGPGQTMEANVGDISYRIERTSDLLTWAGVITEITPLTAGLPPVPAGYTYHSFRTAGPVSGVPSEFIRLRVSSIP